MVTEERTTVGSEGIVTFTVRKSLGDVAREAFWRLLAPSAILAAACGLLSDLRGAGVSDPRFLVRVKHQSLV